jgi:hypothetical protein
VTRWTPLALAMAIALAATAALAIAGCGEDSEVSTVAGPPGSAGAPDPDALEAFQDCMSDHGVDVPEGPVRFGGPPSGDSEDAPARPSGKELRAMQACSDELPTPPQGGGGIQIAPPPGG